MKSAFKNRGMASFRLGPVALALVCAGVLPAWSQTRPILPTWGNYAVTRGTVAVGTGPNDYPTNAAGLPDDFGATLAITQRTPRAIVDWQGFSIGQGSVVNIAQPSASSVLLNRVVGPASSVLAGSMTANGRVFLVNPAGVTFTNTSIVSVGGLVASTLAMSTSDDDFMGGTNTFAFGPFSKTGVDNQGQITTAFGGTVALISGNTLNNGVITTPGGTAALGAGGTATLTLDADGDGLTKLVVTPGSFSGVTNSNVIQADGGRIALMAAGNEAIAMGVVNTAGTLRANSLVSRNGEIVLDSGASTANCPRAARARAWAAAPSA